MDRRQFRKSSTFYSLSLCPSVFDHTQQTNICLVVVRRLFFLAPTFVFHISIQKRWMWSLLHESINIKFTSKVAVLFCGVEKLFIFVSALLCRATFSRLGLCVCVFLVGLSTIQWNKVLRAAHERKIIHLHAKHCRAIHAHLFVFLFTWSCSFSFISGSIDYLAVAIRIQEIFTIEFTAARFVSNRIEWSNKLSIVLFTLSVFACVLHSFENEV